MIRLWKQDKLLLGAILLTILWMGLFLFGSQLAPFDPNETNLGAKCDAFIRYGPIGS